MDGQSLIDQPHRDRRQQLDALGLAELGVPVMTPYAFEYTPHLFTACAALGAEGWSSDPSSR